MNNKINYLVKKYQEGGKQTNDGDVALPDDRKWTDDEIWDLWTSNDFYKNLASDGHLWGSRAMSNQLNKAWNDKTKFLEFYNDAMKHWYNLIYVNRYLRNPSNEELNADAFFSSWSPTGSNLLNQAQFYKSTASIDTNSVPNLEILPHDYPILNLSKYTAGLNKEIRKEEKAMNRSFRSLKYADNINSDTEDATNYLSGRDLRRALRQARRANRQLAREEESMFPLPIKVRRRDAINNAMKLYGFDRNQARQAWDNTMYAGYLKGIKGIQNRRQWAYDVLSNPRTDRVLEYQYYNNEKGV